MTLRPEEKPLELLQSVLAGIARIQAQQTPESNKA